MIPSEPKYLFGIGCLLLIIGWVLPLLMIMQYLESTFFLNFFAYIASLLGLFLGIIGAVSYVQRNRRK